MWSLLFFGIAALIIASLLSQQQFNSGGNVGTVQVKSLTCTIDNYLYPFLSYDNAEKKELKIVATFSEDTLKSIFLQQSLKYSDTELTIQSEGSNHAAMNMLFAEDGLGADALGANYSIVDNTLFFGLYGLYEEMRPTDMKYFLLDKIKNYEYIDIKGAYESLGMTCVGENV